MSIYRKNILILLLLKEFEVNVSLDVVFFFSFDLEKQNKTENRRQIYFLWWHVTDDIQLTQGFT